MEGKADVLLREFEHTSSGRGVLAEVIRSTLSQRMTDQPLRSRGASKLGRKMD